jgi:hypothetical protein
MFDPKNAKPWLWLAGDVVMLLAFVIIGQADHDLLDAENPIWGVLKPSLMFGLPWIVAGVWLNAFQFGDSVRGFFSRSFNAWLVAALLGILVRSLVLGRAVIPTSFLTATIFFGGLFILGWRMVWVFIWHFTQRRTASRAIKDNAPISSA